MRELKAESSRWIKAEFGLRTFAWQEGYGAFSFGAASLAGVRGYIAGQGARHRRVTFREEYVGMLERGLVEYDDEYLW